MDKQNPETESYWHNNSKWLVEEFDEDGTKGIRLKPTADPSLYLRHSGGEIGLAASHDLNNLLDSVWTVERTG